MDLQSEKSISPSHFMCSLIDTDNETNSLRYKFVEAVGTVTLS